MSKKTTRPRLIANNSNAAGTESYFTLSINKYVNIVYQRNGNGTFLVYIVDSREKPPWWKFWEYEVRHIEVGGWEYDLTRSPKELLYFLEKQYNETYGTII